MSVQVARFTAEQYERMIEAGVFPPDYRAELIDGEIIEMSPIGTHHSSCVARLNKLFNRVLDEQLVWVQSPVWADAYSVPEPDVTVLKARADFYAQSRPTPADVLLLVEVSDSTLSYDRKKKLPLYARAGVPEVWIVNIPDDRIEIYSDPAGGAYRTTSVATRGDEVTARAFSSLRLRAEEILG